MRSLKRALPTTRGREFHLPNNPVYLIRRHSYHLHKNGDRSESTCGHPQPCVMLETEIFLDFKGHFYRGMDVRDLCRRATFDEVIFFFLHKRWPNESELKRKNCYVQNELNRFCERNVLEMGRLLQTSDPLQLIRIALLKFSHQSEQQTETEGEPKSTHDPLFNYLKILAASVKLLLRWGHSELVSPPMNDYADFTSFLIDAYPTEGKEVNFHNKGKEEDDAENLNASRESNESKGQTLTPHPWREERIKLLNAFLVCMCEQGINENTFFVRMLSSVQCHNYFSLCVSASTFYIDAFRNVDLRDSLEGFLRFVVPSVGTIKRGEHNKFHKNREPEGGHLRQGNHLDDEIATHLNVDFFFHKGNSYREKNAILKEHLTEYCNNTCEKNLHCLKHFEQVEEFFLKNQKKHASCYYYPLLTFHLLGVPLPLLPSVFFIMRLLSFMAHRQEQITNNKLVKYAGVYVGVPPRGFHMQPLHRGATSPH
ncbi:citrate synthase-like protein, putative [Plasmodium knowlesi strain H]|uniref:Citrate synthase-like protein, putative n=3 Tax=Plasmodium knowlesi TaxID=5850 RepID=A0A5K1UZ45_PLAKH|nr:citrate synthase-like protein, putative [Plasmodium knowlesi strain H]OTN64790.1 putative Citrate synthase-like protein [Plasmodium knowlesi]CAA9989236.1 citrate synthase-like protein, putative [Plasmodium knowlesi strain H]SBO26204.1 citrate synthase-like protein, putative [Plasmodium knowlesi strain H]SBO27106.1 citrate synthase-like protein, putative [Plasmodium knowlesi strain H]VVS78710.1 citrate synthase-like protein, putative [Plasmodium knowlesi strain H]|eukprot:XP_002261582.1 Citrate synthase-like, putative [Plasmodium knowlesi strain H]